MKADFGMNNYAVKIAGVIISALSIICYVILRVFKIDITLFNNLYFTRLATLLFCCGLVLFLFSRDKKTDDTVIRNVNLISRLFLTALYSCLIAYGLIQSINNDYSIDVLTPILFFLILQVIYTLVSQYRDLSNKGFYVFSSVVFVIGLIVIMLL